MLACVTAALMAVVLLSTEMAAPASGQSGETVPLESRWIGTVVAPKRGDHRLPLALYRSLIPAPYTMPAHPLVGLYLVDLYAPHSTQSNQPWNDYDHWLEGGVDLLVNYHGQLGWYHLAMPVNSDFEYGLGRDVGFPKYHAGAVFAPSGSGWSAQAYPATTGYLSESVTWTPAGNVRVPAELVAYATQKQPFFSLYPALVGPTAERTTFTPSPYMPGSLPPPQPGLVHVQLAANIDAWDNTLPHLFGMRQATLRDLIDLDQTVPGVMWHSQALYDIQSATIGQGGYSKSAATSYRRARRAAPHRRLHSCRRGARRDCRHPTRRR